MMIPDLNLTLPYRQRSPLYSQRRDIVLSSVDSFSLRAVIVDSDTPGALTANLISDNPSFRLTVWQHHRNAGPYWWDDYGWPLVLSTIDRVLWSVDGVISSTIPGAVDFTIPAGSMVCWPHRATFAVNMGFDGGLGKVLVRGILELRGGPPGVAATTSPITTPPSTGDGLGIEDGLSATVTDPTLAPAVPGIVSTYVAVSVGAVVSLYPLPFGTQEIINITANDLKVVPPIGSGQTIDTGDVAFVGAHGSACFTIAKGFTVWRAR